MEYCLQAISYKYWFTTSAFCFAAKSTGPLNRWIWRGGGHCSAQQRFRRRRRWTFYCLFRALSIINCNLQPTNFTMFFLRYLYNNLALNISAYFNPPGFVIVLLLWFGALMMIQCGSKHVRTVSVILLYKYLRNNMAHNVGWVLWKRSPFNWPRRHKSGVEV